MAIKTRPDTLTLVDIRGKELTVESRSVGEWHVHPLVRGNGAVVSGAHCVSHRSGVRLAGPLPRPAAYELLAAVAGVPPCPVDDATARKMISRYRKHTPEFEAWRDQVAETVAAWRDGTVRS